MLKPLGLVDKKVLVPRGAGQAKSFSQLVEKYGGISIEIPLIAFRPIELTKELQTAMNEINTYDWIVFTSNVTVETFFSFYKNKDTHIISLLDLQIYRPSPKRGFYWIV